MPMLKRGYGAIRNLRCKSGARFPPSTVCITNITVLEALYHSKMGASNTLERETLNSQP